jgi:hypothetical protein
MGIWDIFKKKKAVDNLTDEDRETSLSIRRAHSDLKKLKEEIELEKNRIELEKVRQELYDLRAENSEEDEEDSGKDDILNTLLVSLLSNTLKPAQTAPQVVPTQAVVLSDDDLKAGFLKRLNPQMIKAGKKLSDDKLKEIGREYFPNFSEDELNRAVKVFRTL